LEHIQNFFTQKSKHKYSHGIVNDTGNINRHHCLKKPSSRKERRESLKGLQCVTTDPNDLIQSENDDKEAQQKMDTKHGHKYPYQNPHHYLQLVKSGYHMTAAM
jgi:hypothetical protein